MEAPAAQALAELQDTPFLQTLTLNLWGNSIGSEGRSSLIQFREMNQRFVYHGF